MSTQTHTHTDTNTHTFDIYICIYIYINHTHTHTYFLRSSAHHCRCDPGEADLTVAEAQLAQEALRLQQQWQQIREQVWRTGGYPRNDGL